MKENKMKMIKCIVLAITALSSVGMAEHITGVTIESVSSVYNNSSEGPYYAEKLIGVSHATGQNIDTGLYTQGPGTHSIVSDNYYTSGQTGTMWMTAGSDTDYYIIFDLGDLYNLDYIKIWNWNNPVTLGRGVRDVDVYVSDANLGYGDPSWSLISSEVLSVAPGSATEAFGDTVAVDSGNVRYVLLDIKSNYGSSMYPTGLSEVRFFSKPTANIPLTYRQDGFTMFGQHPAPYTEAELERDYVDPFENTNCGVLVWGLGPGSVFTFDIDPSIEKIFGVGLTEEEWAAMPEDDRWIHDSVMGMIADGRGPLVVAIERAHELNLKIFGNLSMNHAPNDVNGWDWPGFAGDFQKNHPEYWVPGGTRLDYKHQEVRDHQIAVLRDAVEKGCDGVNLNFTVYPVHLSSPETNYVYLTQFLRDVRAMLDDVGSAQGRSIELMVQLDFNQMAGVYGYIGYDWHTWLDEGLVDTLVPFLSAGCKYYFVNPVDEFIDYRDRIGSSAKIHGCIGHALGFVDTDVKPDGTRDYDRPHTEQMYYAQALTHHRSGADGIQLAMSHTQWLSFPWQNDLANYAYLEFADKEYMVDVGPNSLPLEFGPVDAGQSYHDERVVRLEIADDIKKAAEVNIQNGANVVIYFNRPLEDNEEIKVYVNGNGPVVANSTTETGEVPYPDGSSSNPNGWKVGRQILDIDTNWLKMGENSIRIVYNATAGAAVDVESIRWVDVNIDYNPLPRRKSSLFESKYDMDAAPETTPDWQWLGNGTSSVSDGVYTLDAPSVSGTSYIKNDGGLWSDNATGSWTVEFGYRVGATYGDADYAFSAVAGGASGGVICRFADSSIDFGSPASTISTKDNTDGFHILRIAYDEQSGKVFLWRDGELLVDDGELLTGSYYTNNLNLGDSSSFSTFQGMVDCDFYRFTTEGAFAPDGGSCVEIWQAGGGMATDLNRDCYVDIEDAMIFFGKWMECYNPSDPLCVQ